MVKSIGSTIAMSQRDAVRYSHQTHDEKVAIISITDIDAPIAPFKLMKENGIQALLRLVFDDVDAGPSAMNSDDAERVARFVLELMKDNRQIDRVIVHCAAGRSRSVGVAAAIVKYFTGDDDKFFRAYTPNMKCYGLVLNALHELGD